MASFLFLSKSWPSTSLLSINNNILLHCHRRQCFSNSSSGSCWSCWSSHSSSPYAPPRRRLQTSSPRCSIGGKWSSLNLYHYKVQPGLFGRQWRYLSTKASAATLSTIVKSLPTRLLKDDDLNTFDTTTYQKNNVVYEYDTGKPVVSSSSSRGSNSNSNSQIVDWEFDEYDDKDNDDKDNDDDDTSRIISIEWDDGVTTKHDLITLKRYYDQRQGRRAGVAEEEREQNDTDNADEVSRVLWTDLTEDNVRQSPEMSMTYETLVSQDDDDGAGMKQALKSLYQYGILLITNTPTDDDPSAIAALSAAISGGSVKTSPENSMLLHYLQHRDHDGTDKSITVLPDATDGALRTLYGSVWSTSSSGQADGTSVADSAYGNDGLPLHTDMTYLRDPPGLQIFTMVQPALKGGESVFGDGFAVAEELRRSYPDAYHTLSTTVRRYHSRDEVTGWYLQASGPVIDVRHGTDGRIESIRHNDLDRLPDVPPSHLTTPDEIDEFYNKLDDAHQAWDTLIQQDKFRLIMKLRPGDTMVVANQRCFHGRCSFESNNSTPRSVIGCYVSQDELLSRMRMEGYDV
mmetsp:Transcript_50167/g.121555  ORF Transcript_50167/g.121555 Transcript_50167/m.121555 type:complete len:572 (-) Transcript_50167:67-1782(-)